MIKLETTAAAREVHMQEETTRALARGREVQATMAKRERSQLQSKLAMSHGYTMILMGELRVARIPILPSPHIPSWGPIITSYEFRYMPAPPSPLGDWDSFAQT